MREDILARGEDPRAFPVLNERPELFRDLVWIWEGFMVLSMTRQYGMSAPQPISVADINAYCTLNGINGPDDREDFVHHVLKLDTQFQADWRVKNPAPGGKKRRGPQGGNFQ